MHGFLFLQLFVIHVVAAVFMYPPCHWNQMLKVLVFDCVPPLPSMWIFFSWFL